MKRLLTVFLFLYSVVMLSGCQFSKDVVSTFGKDCKISYSCNGLAEDLLNVIVDNIPNQRERIGFKATQLPIQDRLENIRIRYPKQYWQGVKALKRQYKKTSCNQCTNKDFFHSAYQTQHFT